MKQIKTIVIAVLLGHAVLSNVQAWPQPLQGFMQQFAKVSGSSQPDLHKRFNQIMQKDAASLTTEEQGLRQAMLNLNAVAQSQGMEQTTITGMVERSIAKVSQHANAFRVTAPQPITLAASQPRWYW